MKYIGYLFINKGGYSGLVFLLPKLFLQKESAAAGAGGAAGVVASGLSLSVE